MHCNTGGIEMHVHGGGGRDFMEGTEEAFRVAVDAHLQNGTTAIFPTLSSSTVPMIEAAMETCDKLMAEPDSPIMGLHLEGPYFNPKQAGAQIPEWIKAPVAEEYEPLLKKSKCLKRWDEARSCRFGRVYQSLLCPRCVARHCPYACYLQRRACCQRGRHDPRHPFLQRHARSLQEP